MGNRDVLAIFGVADASCVDVYDFALGAVSVSIGEDMTFSFKVRAKKAAKVRLEYGVHYVKANGGQSRKIFQITETSFMENQEKTYVKTLSLDVYKRQVLQESLNLHCCPITDRTGNKDCQKQEHYCLCHKLHDDCAF